MSDVPWPLPGVTGIQAKSVAKTEGASFLVAFGSNLQSVWIKSPSPDHLTICLSSDIE